MNKSIRRVALAVLALFGALLINANYVQVGEANALKHNPNNHRLLLSQYSHRRGPIIVAGHAVAESHRTHDAYNYQRTYPGGAIYAPVTGYYPLTGLPTGIERYENDILSGDSDKFFVRKISDYFTGRNPEGGASVLTLNPNAQQAAYSAMSGRRGAVVALDPRTGAILAMVSTPSFDPNPLASHNEATVKRAYAALNNRSDAPLLNRSIQQLYPPGSTFKVITAATALSHGYHPSSDIPAPSELHFADAKNFPLPNFQGETCSPAGHMTLQAALAVSCNTAFGGLGVRLGGDAIASQAAAFGFGHSFDVPMPTASSSFAKESSSALAARAGIGQDNDVVTPLQMALVAAGVANKGVVMNPYLVARALAPDLTTVSTTHPSPFGQAVSANVAAELTQMMKAVVTNGTGAAAQIPGVSVAGKTGTAENVPGQPTHAWFIGFAPADNPRVAVAVIVEHGGVGGQTAAPIARQVMQAVLSQ